MPGKLLTFCYEWATPDERGEFTVNEYSEGIANIEAKHTLERMVNVATLVKFDLVCRRPAS